MEEGEIVHGALWICEQMRQRIKIVRRLSRASATIGITGESDATRRLNRSREGTVSRQCVISSFSIAAAEAGP